MTIRLTLALGAGAFLALSAPAMAQQEPHFTLPERCLTPVQDTAPDTQGAAMHGDHGAMAPGDAPMGHGDSPAGDDAAAMPEHVQTNLEKMAVTMEAMHMGMVQEDADIAFACGMIAHHQVAIDMAEVLLEHGEDPEMRGLATEIIEAQTAEIDRMTRWLETAAQ